MAGVVVRLPFGRLFVFGLPVGRFVAVGPSRIVLRVGFPTYPELFQILLEMVRLIMDLGPGLATL